MLLLCVVFRTAPIRKREVMTRGGMTRTCHKYLSRMFRVRNRYTIHLFGVFIRVGMAHSFQQELSNIVVLFEKLGDLRDVI